VPGERYPHRERDHERRHTHEHVACTTRLANNARHTGNRRLLVFTHLVHNALGRFAGHVERVGRLFKG
jgi:hypothetical protein